MKAWIYRAALYCDDCVTGFIEELRDMNTKDTGDSDDFPQGPYDDGGGEADYPVTCGTCDEHLENPLTCEGRELLRARLRDNPSELDKSYAEFYSVETFDNPDEILAHVHGPIFYRTELGWRRFLADVTPLPRADTKSWRLTGWIVLNTTDTGTEYHTHMHERVLTASYGLEVGCWAWLNDIQ